MKRNETEGIVLELRGELAFVRFDCSYCFQGEELQRVNVEMKNEINAVVGDKVIFETREGDMLIAAFIIFILPFILVYFGAVAGYKISEILRINATVTAIVGGILLFVISMIIIKTSKYTNLKPVITKKA
ncbi:MAG: SoxR reducing system RseC family protein [Desulfitobacteriaceae bacterium]